MNDQRTKKARYRCKNCYGFFETPRKYDNGEIGCDFCGHDDITKNEENYFEEWSNKK